MRSSGLSYISIFALLQLLFVNNILTFDVSLVFSSQVYSGSTLPLKINNAPNRVNVKFAVENSDKSLTAIDSSTVFNVIPSSFVTSIQVSSSIEPGINYWVMVIDTEDSNNYATFGPFSISKLGGDIPSKSVTLGSSPPSTSSSRPTATVNDSSLTATSQSTPTSQSTFTSQSASTSQSVSTPTSSTTSKESTSTYQPKSNGSQSSDNESPFKLSIGTIVGIAFGGAAAMLILIAILICCVLRKLRRSAKPTKTTVTVTPRPMARPSNNISNNSSTIPIVAASNNNVKSGVKPATTVASFPQKTEIEASPRISSPSPLHTGLPTSTSKEALSPVSETTHKYQYPINFTAPEYPPQSHPLNFNQHNMPYYLPMNDSMPIPEHHPSANSPYPPLSPTFYNYPPSQQQPYPPYPPYGPTQFNARSDPFNSSSTAAKTEESAVYDDNTLLAQNVEYDGITSDNKVEYYQKPDTAGDEPIAFVHNKTDQKHK